MLNVKVDSTAVRLKLDAMPAKIRAKVELTIGILAEKLRSHIAQDKLMGQVLHRVTGRLGRSIQYRVEKSATRITGIVYSAGDVPYAAIHEFGGQTPPHVITPKSAKALAFMMGGQQVFAMKVNHPGSRIPERSYMRSGLADMREEIISRIAQSINESIQL